MKQKLEWGPNDEKQIRNLDTTKDAIPMMRNQMNK